jgi:type VII secretion integral membrane protein EccD
VYETTTSDLCHLLIRGPERGFEISVPTGVPLIELLPTLISYAAVEGENLGEVGVEHDGWVLQRLGSEPLDEEGTAGSLDLRDGETLYLRPRREQLPPVHFDDLVDGVATGIRERPSAWRPSFTRRMLLGLALGAIAAALVVLTREHGDPRIIGGVGVGLLMMFGATVASRAIGDAVAGSALGVATVPFFAFAGGLAPTGTAGHALTGARLLAAGASGAAAAVFALAGVAAAAPVFLAAAAAGLIVAVGGAVMLVADVPLTSTAGVAAFLTVAVGGFVPVLSFRLSGLRLPPLPTNAEQLQEGIDPHPSRDVLSRTTIADQHMTALYAMTGLVCAACMTVLAGGHGWSPRTFGLVLAALLLCHSRGLAGAWQRLSVMVPGAYGAVVIPLAMVWNGEPQTRQSMLLSLVAAATVLLMAGWTLPGRRVVPYWGRIADIVQSGLAIALIPLLIADLGLFGFARGLGG